jgi:broad specificity phosphatase PhoE
MPKIYLFRTGSVNTKENIFLGWKDVPLSKKGINEAKKVKKKLKNKKFKYAFCSDQLRCKESLVEVLGKNSKASVFVDKRIREKNHGVFTGKSKELVSRYFPQKYFDLKKSRNENIPKGENYRMVSIRTFSFINDVIDLIKKENSDVLICAHNASVKLLREFFENLEHYETANLEVCPDDLFIYKISFD